MKTLGIIGGTSWHSTIEYYRSINSAVNRVYGNQTNPPLLLLILNQHEIHILQTAERWDAIADIYSDAAQRLETAGSDAVLFAANTPHKISDIVSRRLSIPILHIGDATGAAISSAGFDVVGLIGTRITVEHEFLRARLLNLYGVRTVTPASGSSRERLHQIIHTELGLGIFRAETKAFIMQEIGDLARRGARGIVLSER